MDIIAQFCPNRAGKSALHRDLSHPFPRPRSPSLPDRTPHRARHLNPHCVINPRILCHNPPFTVSKFPRHRVKIPPSVPLNLCCRSKRINAAAANLLLVRQQKLPRCRNHSFPPCLLQQIFRNVKTSMQIFFGHSPLPRNVLYSSS